MTAVAIWHDGGVLQALADTRISVGGEGGRIIRTDSASKLLALPVLCMPVRQMTGVTYTPHSQRTHGFAFAGDSLPAMMTYATAIACLNDLQGHDSAEPALRDIANFVAKIGTRFGRDAAQAMNRAKLPFEVAVFGWCPVLRDYSIYTLKPDGDDALALGVTEIRPNPFGPLVVLGSRGQEVNAEVDRLRGGDSRVGLGRFPRDALEKMVAEASRTEDIGGSVSYGVADAQKFQLMMRLTRYDPNRGTGFVTFNNMEIGNEVGSVGHYRVGLMATR